ncbi:MAG: hypothetical protein AB1746_09440, partial [Candidatus Zixiibacteriota bacterium]
LIISIESPRFTDRKWMACQEMLNNLRRKYDSFFFDIPWQQLKEQQLSLKRADKHQHRFGIFDGDSCVGWVFAQGRNAGEPEQSLFCSLDADYDRIPREFSRIVAEALARLLESYGLSELEYMGNCQRTIEPAEHWMGKRLNLLNRFQLVRANANNDIMDKWLREFPAKYPSLRLEFHDQLPDNYIVRFTELFTQFFREMPDERNRGVKFHITPEIFRMHDKWRRENNRAMYIFTLHDKDDMIGFTNAMIARHDPANAYQAMSGIVSKYRGKGLSKWLKAALFRKIGEDFPGNKSMITDMRAVNYPIQAVNEQMGYKLTSEGAEYSILLEKLKEFAAQKV